MTMSAVAAPPRRSIAGNAALLMVSQATTWLLGFVIAIALPRHLGPAVLGQLQLSISLWAVAGVVVAAGTHLLLTKEFARDPDAGAAIVGSATTLQVLAYLVTWVGIAVFVTLAGYRADVVAVIAIIGLSVAFTPFAGTARAALYGLERMEFVAMADVATKALHVIAVLSLIVAGVGVRGIAGASALYGIGSAALLWYFLGRFGVPCRLRLTGLARVARCSRSYMASDVALVVYQQIDVIVISLLVQHEALGWYSTADGIFASLLFLPSIMMTSLFPVFSRLHSVGTEERDALLVRSFESLLVIAVPIGLGTLAVAQPLALLLFGEEFAGTGPVLAVMGVVLTLTYLTILLGRYALAIDRQEFWIRLMVGATTATVALDLVLVPWTERVMGNGAVGGALAYLATESVMLFLGIRKLAPEIVCRSTVVRTGKCTLAGAVMLLAVWPLRWQFLAVPVLVGMVTYAAMLLTLRVLGPEEIQMTRTAIQRLVRRDHCEPAVPEPEVMG